MAIRRGLQMLGAAGVAAVVLAGCGSGTNSAGTTSAAATSSSAMSSMTSAMTSEKSSAMSSDSSDSDMSSSLSLSVTATTTVGGGTTSLDAQSTAWFETLCTGVSPLADLEQTMKSVSSGQELGSAMTTVGTAFTDTAAKLADQPAPTFDGGQELASNTQTAMQTFGQTFQDFGARAAQISNSDTAGQQQFLQDFQAALTQSPLAEMKLSPDVQQAVQQIPACQKIMGGAG
ncbi:hypothetical protein [Nakamurella sp.]|uniref:hypothetical protein n=1 Tax=Nakamurella sp. TaxID=1869182 RepID=UPI003B3A6048